MAPLYRDEALSTLEKAVMGRNLYDVARELQVPILIGGKLNKGWVGQTLERSLGLSTNSLAETDGADFELKGTTLLPRDSHWVPKETIKITQLNPEKILEEKFETSLFWRKLSRLIVVGYQFETPGVCTAKKILRVDIDEPGLIKALRNFWQDVQNLVLTGEIADHTTLGSASDFVQLRGMGTGRIWSICPVSGRRFPARAFYATKRLIQLWLS